MTPKLAASLCGDAYSDPLAARYSASVRGLNDVACFDEGGTQGFVGVLDNITVVVFRGTKIEIPDLNWWDILTLRAVGKIRKSIIDVLFDIKMFRVEWPCPGTVHQGFLMAEEAASLEVERLIGQRRTPAGIHILGHSLGAAVGQIFAAKLAMSAAEYCEIRCTSFGCPASMSEDAAKYTQGKVLCRNYVRCADIVPRLLGHKSGFYRPGSTKYLNRNCKERVNATGFEKLRDRCIARLKDIGKLGLVDIKHHSIISSYVKCLGAK